MPAAESETRPRDPRFFSILVVFVVLALPALLALVVYSLFGEIESVGLGLLTAASAFAAGALVGFLFGIPRMAPRSEESDGSPRPHFEPNTNLEQISDWLTKILVGVGLVQVNKLGGAINDLAGGLEGGLGDSGHAVAVMLLVAFTITGFLTSYLFTRINLQSAFEPFREALKKQEKSLTDAIPLVRRQLDPGGETKPSPAELTDALRATSSGIRDEAFYLARDQRRANWTAKEGSDKRLVDLTIPVFEALVTLDVDRDFHRNRGELGYALKDQENPHDADYERARDCLTAAIEIRGADNAASFSMYEFNRAFCNIRLDPALAAERPSEKPAIDIISHDLEVAAATGFGLRAIKAAVPVKRWLKLNREDPRIEDLRTRISAVQA